MAPGDSLVPKCNETEYHKAIKRISNSLHITHNYRYVLLNCFKFISTLTRQKKIGDIFIRLLFKCRELDNFALIRLQVDAEHRFPGNWQFFLCSSSSMNLKTVENSLCGGWKPSGLIWYGHMEMTTLNTLINISYQLVCSMSLHS